MGPTGAIGPRGVQGIQGDPGPAGPTGTAAMAAYGTFESIAPRIITVGGPVILDMVQTTGLGLAFTPGTSSVTVAAAGVYRVMFSVKTTLAIGATIRLLVNGAAVPGSSLEALADISQRTGYATLTLAAGDTLEIGTTGVAVTLAAGANAFLDIVKVA